MGRQRIDICFAYGRMQRDVPVFRSEVMDLPGEFAGVQIQDVVLHVPLLNP